MLLPHSKMVLGLIPPWLGSFCVEFSPCLCGILSTVQRHTINGVKLIGHRLCVSVRDLYRVLPCLSPCQLRLFPVCIKIWSVFFHCDCIALNLYYLTSQVSSSTQWYTVLCHWSQYCSDDTYFLKAKMFSNVEMTFQVSNNSAVFVVALVCCVRARCITATNLCVNAVT